MKAFSHILLASDFSERSGNAEQRILQLTHAGLAELRLLHALPGSLMEELKRLIAGGVDVRLRDVAMRQLEERASRFAAIPGLKVEYLVETGRPHTVVIALAEETDSLIVIGAHGGHAVRDWFQGSMVERMLDGSRQPLLVVKQPAQTPYRRVLVPVDFSPSSASTVEAAIKIAPQAEIVLLHVFEIPFENKLCFAGVSDAELTDYRASGRQQAERDMAAFIRSLPDLGVQPSMRLEYGYAPEIIIEQAGQLACDLIVMGRYGQSGVGQLLLGSVTEYVVMECGCDIMVVSG
ncbi:Putative universal stress protein [Methylophilaceae bacterium]|nr:Putative universal stress protein [Methylophilaceae bacterium]